MLNTTNQPVMVNFLSAAAFSQNLHLDYCCRQVWDLRHRHAVMTIRESDDYLSDMVVDETKKILLATR